MKKFVSVILTMVVLLSIIIGLTGCMNNQELQIYVRRILIEQGDTTDDYSKLVGDWYTFFSSITTILRVFNVEENEITFNLITFHPFDQHPYPVLKFTLPIIDNQVQFEDTITIFEGDTHPNEGLKRNNSLTFYDNYILWHTEIPDNEFEFERRFVPLMSLDFGQYWADRVNEILGEI